MAEQDWQGEEALEALEAVGAVRALDEVHARIGGYFHRREMRERVRRYLEGLLSHVERKNSWQLAEGLGETGPQGVQRLFTDADWDAEAVRDELRTYVVEQLGDAESGVVVVDETGFVKKGTKSAGVARQYSGTAGRRENQQIGVFLLYASDRGAAFIDRALYLPDEWMGDAERREEAHIPAGVGFATKGEIARDLLARAFAAGVPAQWVVGDTVYSADELRRWLEGQGRHYVLAVPETHAVCDPWPPADGRAPGRGPCPPTPGRRCRRGRAAKGRAGMTGPVWRCPTPEQRARPIGCSRAAAAVIPPSWPTTGCTAPRTRR